MRRRRRRTRCGHLSADEREVEMYDHPGDMPGCLILTVMLAAVALVVLAIVVGVLA